jgi:hypothetical protein
MKKAIVVSALVLAFALFAFATCPNVIFCSIDGEAMFPAGCETNESQHTITCRYEHTHSENGRSMVHYKYVQCY